MPLPPEHSSLTTAEFQEKLSCLPRLPEVRLFVRAAVSERDRIGACLICQQWLMVFRTMVEANLVKLEVVPISYDYEPEDYKCLHASKRLPAAFLPDFQLAASTTDELETLLSKFQYDRMKLPFEAEAVGAALRSFIDVYLTMVGFVRNNAERPLLTALQQLEDYLQSHGTRYLLGDEPTFADCMLMPKLQHLRVILRACKQWDIPLEFVNVWKYVKSMYETPVFTVCCPCDRDILMHYKDKKALDIPEHLLKQAADTYLHACPTQLPA
ncbi:Chloride intracellular channel protein 6 [Sparganum proliferum]